MKDEFQNNLKRIEDAIALKKPDRIPVVPFMVYFPIAYKGLTHDYVFKTPGTARRAMQETFQELGGYDAVVVPDFIWPTYGGRTPFAPVPRIMPGKNAPAGDDLSSFRMTEIMTHEDYDIIIAKGWYDFLSEYLPRSTGRSTGKIKSSQERLMVQFKEGVQSWEKMGVPTLFGCIAMPPYDILSSCRSLEKFTVDVYRMPEKIKDVMESMWEDIVKIVIDTVQVSGIKRVMIGMSTASGQYAPPRIFDEFDFPFIKRMVNRLLEEGVTSIVFHMDSDYTKNMDRFLELPKGKCVLEVEYTIDIFALKEKVRGHHCIMGNMLPSLLVEKTSQDVENYTKKLMDIVGEDGGFILSTSCDCPLDAKFENVKAMVETGRNYKPRHYMQ